MCGANDSAATYSYIMNKGKHNPRDTHGVDLIEKGLVADDGTPKIQKKKAGGGPGPENIVKGLGGRKAPYQQRKAAGLGNSAPASTANGAVVLGGTS